jgi:hypothetical protein
MRPSQVNAGVRGTMKGALKTAVTGVATLALWFPAAAHEGIEGATPIDESRLRAAIASVRTAILAEDARTLLQNISKVASLTCTDTRYTHEEVGAFLRDRASHLYISLFDTSTFSKQCGGQYPAEYPAISEKEFLRSANESVRIVRLDAQWAEVTLTSPVPTHYPREWYFHWESGAWKLAGRSLIVGNCSCG